MADCIELNEEFMTEYVLDILDEGAFDLKNILEDEILFVETVIVRLIGYNWKRNTEAAIRLTLILHSTQSARKW